MITQREVGIDTESFITAMRHAVRQDPDVILIGEMRDPETFSVAMTASETGHLVISTLHTADVTQSLLRLFDFFPPSQYEQVRFLLAMNLKALTCQELVNRADGKGLVPAVEVMITTSPVAKLIRENRFEKIPLVIQSGEYEGMQTFNQSLLKLVKSKMITESEAMAKSPNPDALKMNLSGIFLDEERKIIDDMA
jgi:twitching motility protein PilT